MSEPTQTFRQDILPPIAVPIRIHNSLIREPTLDPRIPEDLVAKVATLLSMQLGEAYDNTRRIAASADPEKIVKLMAHKEHNMVLIVQALESLGLYNIHVSVTNEMSYIAFGSQRVQITPRKRANTPVRR